MKKRIWRLHSILGLGCGLLLTVIALSGSALVFQEELTRTLFSDTVMSDAPADSERQSIDRLIAETRRAHPDFWVAGWLFPKEPQERDIAYLKRKGTDDWHKLRVDPYSGKTAPRPLAYRETLQGWLVDLHYTFFADHLGIALTGFLAVGLCLLSITGLWIYRAFWKNLFRLRWKASARILFSDIHKAAGIASIPFNLLLGFTGAYWNIAHLAEEAEEEHDHAAHAADPYLAHVPLEGALQDVRSLWPETSINYIYFPNSEDAHFYFYGALAEDRPLESPYGSWLAIDAKTGDIAQQQKLQETGAWSRAVDAFEPLHFGNFGGIASKALWTILGLAPGLLAFSGSLIWFKRRRPQPPVPVRAAADRQKSLAAPSDISRAS